MQRFSGQSLITSILATSDKAVCHFKCRAVSAVRPAPLSMAKIQWKRHQTSKIKWFIPQAMQNIPLNQKSADAF